MWKNVVLPDGFWNGVDVVALAATLTQPCSRCGHRHDGVGVAMSGGGLFCQRCGFRTEARVAKTKRQRRAPAKRRPIVRVRRPLTSSRRPRERRSRQRHGGSSGQRGPPDDGDGPLSRPRPDVGGRS